MLARDTALFLGQVSTKYPGRCRPKKNQIIPTTRYRPSVKCRPFTGCRTLLSAAPRLIVQYDQWQYYHRLVPGGGIQSCVPPLYRVTPLPGAAPRARVALEIFAHVDAPAIRHTYYLYVKPCIALIGACNLVAAYLY